MGIRHNVGPRTASFGCSTAREALGSWPVGRVGSRWHLTGGYGSLSSTLSSTISLLRVRQRIWNPPMRLSSNVLPLFPSNKGGFSPSIPYHSSRRIAVPETRRGRCSLRSLRRTTCVRTPCIVFGARPGCKDCGGCQSDRRRTVHVDTEVPANYVLGPGTIDRSRSCNEEVNAESRGAGHQPPYRIHLDDVLSGRVWKYLV